MVYSDLRFLSLLIVISKILRIWCYSMFVIQLNITDIFGCKYEISLLFHKCFFFIEMYNLHNVLDFLKRVADVYRKKY